MNRLLTECNGAAANLFNFGVKKTGESFDKHVGIASLAVMVLGACLGLGTLAAMGTFSFITLPPLWVVAAIGAGVTCVLALGLCGLVKYYELKRNCPEKKFQVEQISGESYVRLMAVKVNEFLDKFDEIHDLSRQFGEKKKASFDAVSGEVNQSDIEELNSNLQAYISSKEVLRNALDRLEGEMKLLISAFNSLEADKKTEEQIKRVECFNTEISALRANLNSINFFI